MKIPLVALLCFFYTAYQTEYVTGAGKAQKGVDLMKAEFNNAVEDAIDDIDAIDAAIAEDEHIQEDEDENIQEDDYENIQEDEYETNNEHKTCKKPTVCGNAYGATCQFPFIYKKKLYGSCTLKDHDSFWCATTKDYDTDKKWGECKGMRTQPAYHTTGGNSNGQCCKFPFVYKKKTYYGCTKKDEPVYWCATTSNYDKDCKWGACIEDKTCKKPTVGGNANGTCCQFPFVYKKKLYHSCTKEDCDTFWCATTLDYDTDKKWGECKGTRTEPVYHTTGGNANGQFCKFPFIYKMKTYYGCTKKDEPMFWCATTSNYDKDKKWGACIEDKTCKKPTVCGNAYGACCQFPFVYEKKLYHSCTKTNHDRLWCATTMDYDTDKKWGECKGTMTEPAYPTVGGNADGRCCKFPFIYQQKTYHGCIDNNEAFFWCPTTSNYDKDKKWGECKGKAPLHRS